MTLPAVLITGGAKRIGGAISRRFAQAGWHVLVHYGHSREDAEALAAELPSAEAVHCDLADADAAEAMIEGLGERLANWRVLVNSGSVFEYDGPERIDPAISGD